MKFVSTGISISSINRIKELAEERKFKEALEILDTQNLEKSINPQFLKISGEIFRENKRYYDSRKILLKAHQMAPQGNRILLELIQLYLELGYFSKAKKYYEQYMFYTTPDDTLKDYVEYIMKKATGADVKDLAAILIPILERMPEDKWNFEAILLYDKMDRKDMALEESRYILENFKESEFVQPVIEYIDDKLDVDKWFYIYPREEQPEDKELFGDLIELEEKILEADHLRMYPPEARIMVEADDKDAVDAPPVKEKKPKKAKGLKKKKGKASKEEAVAENGEVVTAEAVEDDKKPEDKGISTDVSQSEDTKQAEAEVERKESSSETKTLTASEQAGDGTDSSNKEETENAEDEQLKKEREAALEKILSKKIDKDKIKESAKQVAKAVKEIDTDKAKKQVKSVAATVKDNVKKATDALGEAVGTKAAEEAVTASVADNVADVVVSSEEFIMDGIIEGVLEPPKKTVGEVVMNEELDSLIPDSLEAMSQKEIADIEAKKEEFERLELEALETNLKLEEEKKEKRQALLKKVSQQKTSEKTTQSDDAEDTTGETAQSEDEVVQTEEADTDVEIKEELSSEEVAESTDEDRTLEEDTKTESEVSFTPEKSSYTELKNQFMKDMEEEKPLDSLGFISVVHSDVDTTMEEVIPDAAGVLRQMIDNKEFYSGESSLGFESEASYLNHGFEVEDYDFDTYRQQLDSEQPEDYVEDTVDVEEPVMAEAEQPAAVEETTTVEEPVVVEEIFAQENIVAFEDVAEESATIMVKESVTGEEAVAAEEPATIAFEEPVAEEETVVTEEPVVTTFEEMVPEESVDLEEDVYTGVVESRVNESMMIDSEDNYGDSFDFATEEETVAEEKTVVTEEPMITEFEESVTEEEPVITEFEESIPLEDAEDVYTGEVESRVNESMMIDSADNYGDSFDFNVEEESAMAKEPVAVEPEKTIHVEVYTAFAEPVVAEETETFTEPVATEESIFIVEEQKEQTIVESEFDLRAHLRANIVLTYRMESILQELKGK